MASLRNGAERSRRPADQLRVRVRGGPLGCFDVTDFVQVSTATETREAAVALAQSAVRARLAAGAQIVGPVVSVFWHHGEFGSGEEWQLLLKARADRYSDLQAHLLAHHPWSNPEIIAVPILEGSKAYLDWVAQTTEPGQS